MTSLACLPEKRNPVEQQQERRADVIENIKTGNGLDGNSEGSPRHCGSHGQEAFQGACSGIHAMTTTSTLP
jgi:hypothetical protein